MIKYAKNIRAFKIFDDLMLRYIDKMSTTRSTKQHESSNQDHKVTLELKDFKNDILKIDQ